MSVLHSISGNKKSREIFYGHTEHDINVLADIYRKLSSSEKNPKQKNKYKQKYQKWQRKAKEVLNRRVEK